ncbi:YciI family protein [Phenylobacterium soli]|uniref:YciI family protein n=1 Tax=Phenylobacterium soli TaxID=2170551 RepID=A0A328AS63_9CAUL|nr:YciI family protein [Phenylobacterium soli]RAK55768.1 YciI family protein [Phenylobacterium soli]
MHYLLILHVDESGWLELTPEERSLRTAEYMAFNEALQTAGALVSTGRLTPSRSGRTLTTKGGRPIVTDGPFAETKEQVGGYYLIEAADLASASQWAARCPTVGHGAVELREVMAAPS